MEHGYLFYFIFHHLIHVSLPFLSSKRACHVRLASLVSAKFMVIYSLLSCLHSPNVHACSPLLSSHSTGYISISYPSIFFPSFFLVLFSIFLFFPSLLSSPLSIYAFTMLLQTYEKKKSIYINIYREREMDETRMKGQAVNRSQFVFIIFSLTKLTRIGEERRERGREIFSTVINGNFEGRSLTPR